MKTNLVRIRDDHSLIPKRGKLAINDVVIAGRGATLIQGSFPAVVNEAPEILSIEVPPDERKRV